eukprot:6778009-Ditylum_brightwellii.AAC.1
MEMTDIIKVPDLKGFAPVSCPSNYDMIDLKNIYTFFMGQSYMTCLQIVMQIIPYDNLPLTKDVIANQMLAY